MNREIKFRAFDKATRQMCRIISIDLFMEEVELGTIEDTSDVTENGNLLQRSYDEVVIMQFTGIKDMNGKNMYEGDIIAQKMPSGTIYRGEIVFENGAFRIREEPNDSNPKIYNKDIIGGLSEVIGNIYKNKE